MFKIAVHAYRMRMQNFTILRGGKICGINILLNAANCGKDRGKYQTGEIKYFSPILSPDQEYFHSKTYRMPV